MDEQALSALAARIDETQSALNFLWVLIAAFLVMFMQAGFALVETGLVRAKNAAHTMAMNFLVYSIGILAYWAVGFGLQMGGVGALATLGGDATLDHEFTVQIAGKAFGLFGTEGFFLSPSVLTPAVAALFLFQMVFMDTTATIPTGALAERWRLASFVPFSIVIAALIYPVYGNWVWGGGFLATLGTQFGLGHGHVDFAGSSVVHLTGGVLAFVCAKAVGPRVGKYGPDGTPRPLPGHNLPMAVLGTFILAFGWFGFNAGSTLAATDTRTAVVAVNTMLASAAGALVSFGYTRLRLGAPDLSMSCNGMLAGLVAITAPCAFVGTGTAVILGALSGVLVVESTLFVERKLRIDDPVGAISVHGVHGALGILAVGLAADGTYGQGLNGVSGGVRGLFYGDAGQLAASALGILANVVWVGLVASVTLFVVGKLVGGHRPSEEDERLGLDVPELGAPGYAPDLGELEPLDEEPEEITQSYPGQVPEVLRG